MRIFLCGSVLNEICIRGFDDNVKFAVISLNTPRHICKEHVIVHFAILRNGMKPTLQRRVGPWFLCNLACRVWSDQVYSELTDVITPNLEVCVELTNCFGSSPKFHLCNGPGLKKVTRRQLWTKTFMIRTYFYQNSMLALTFIHWASIPPNAMEQVSLPSLPVNSLPSSHTFLPSITLCLSNSLSAVSYHFNGDPGQQNILKFKMLLAVSFRKFLKRK